MIVIYTSPGCASCRKAKAWLKENNLPFIEKNIFSVPLNKTEVKYLLQRSENGVEDIISKRSKIIQEQHVDLESMSLNELVDFVIQHPSIMRRPLIINNSDFQIGYDSEEIDAFLSEKMKQFPPCSEKCPNYEKCESGECE